MRYLGATLRRRYVDEEPVEPVPERTPVRTPVRSDNAEYLPPQFALDQTKLKYLIHITCERALEMSQSMAGVHLARPYDGLLYFTDGCFLVPITDNHLQQLIDVDLSVQALFKELPGIGEAVAYNRTGMVKHESGQMLNLMRVDGGFKTIQQEFYPTPWGIHQKLDKCYSDVVFSIALTTKPLRRKLAISDNDAVYVQYEVLSLFNRQYWKLRYYGSAIYPNGSVKAQPIYVMEENNSFPLGAVMPVTNTGADSASEYFRFLED